MRTGRLGVVVALLLLTTVILAGGGSSDAAVGPIIAGPGNAFSPLYYTPRVVSLKGQSAVFRNLDIVQHDVVSVTGKFSTPRIGFNKQANVVGVKNLARGTYNFFCTLHPIMKGQLIIR